MQLLETPASSYSPSPSQNPRPLPLHQTERGKSARSDEHPHQLYRKTTEKITNLDSASCRDIIHKACNPIQTFRQRFHSTPEFF